MRILVFGVVWSCTHSWYSIANINMHAWCWYEPYTHILHCNVIQEDFILLSCGNGQLKHESFFHAYCLPRPRIVIKYVARVGQHLVPQGLIYTMASTEIL